MLDRCEERGRQRVVGLSTLQITRSLVRQHPVEYLQYPIVRFKEPQVKGDQLMPEVSERRVQLLAGICAQSGQDKRNFLLPELLPGLFGGGLPDSVRCPEKIVCVNRKVLDMRTNRQFHILPTMLLQIPAPRAVSNDPGHDKGETLAVERGLAIEIRMQDQVGGYRSHDDHRQLGCGSQEVVH